MLNLSRFTRFSWGKIQFGRFARCKRFDISQLWWVWVGVFCWAAYEWCLLNGTQSSSTQCDPQTLEIQWWWQYHDDDDDDDWSFSVKKGAPENGWQLAHNVELTQPKLQFLTSTLSQKGLVMIPLMMEVAKCLIKCSKERLSSGSWSLPAHNGEKPQKCGNADHDIIFIFPLTHGRGRRENVRGWKRGGRVHRWRRLKIYKYI